MSEEAKNLIESVEFRVTAPKGDLRGLDAPLEKLLALDRAVATLQGRLAGLTTNAFKNLDFKQVLGRLQEGGAKGKISATRAAEMIGLPNQADMQEALRQWSSGVDKEIRKAQRVLERGWQDMGKSVNRRTTPWQTEGTWFRNQRGQQQQWTNDRITPQAAAKELRHLKDKTGLTGTTFSSPTKAAEFLSHYAGQLAATETEILRAFHNLTGGRFAGPASAPLPPPAAAPGGSRSPRGKNPVAPGASAEASPAAAPATRTATGKFQDALEKIKLELERNLNTADLDKIAGARGRAAEQVKALVKNAADVKDRNKDTALKFAAMQERKAVEARQQGLSAAGENVFQLRKKLAAAEKVGQQEKAQQLKREIATEEARIASLKTLDKVFYKPAQQLQQQRAKNAAAVSALEASRASGAARVQSVGAAWNDFLAHGGRVTHDEMVMDKKGARRELRGEMTVGNTTRVFSASIGEADAKLRTYSKTVEEAQKKTGWLGTDFLTNTAKIAKWSLSVGVLYKTLGLAEHSFQTFLTVSGKMAVLDQIFRKVGGTTLELTSDILHLAAVTGRSGEEAMESAISWSRLGLSRVQVNEAVRLSLVAANVTQLSAGETTEHLQAISQNYGLTLSQLAAKLGELNQISNVYNVTNADLLQGVSRSAALAKQAGMSFEELLGLIGATVGATKQTGANIGNAIKTIITSLGSPQLQEKLRMFYGVSSETSGGHARGVPEVLDQIYVRYQKLSNLQQRALTFTISGKFQSQRLSAMLDNYVRAQVLAIDAQLHLNTAEQENLKIVGSLKAQLAGLSAEWERFVVIQGNNGPAQALGQIATALRNVLGLLDSKAGSVLTTMLLGLGTAAVAKTGLAMMTAKSGVKGSFIGGTQEQLLLAALALNGFTNRAVNGTAAKMAARGLGWAGAPPWFLGGNTKVGNALGYGLGTANIWGANALTSMNQFGNAKLTAANKALQEMRLVSAAANAALGGTVKALALASAALVEFAIPIALVVGGIYLFNKAMDAMEGNAEASRKRLAGLNEEMERSAAAAGAMSQAAKLFQTATATLAPMAGFGSITKKNAFRMFDQMQEAVGLQEPDLEKRRALQGSTVRRWKESFVEGGDNAAILADMRQQRESYVQSQRERLRENRSQRRRAQEELAAQQHKLETMNANPTWWDHVAGGVPKRQKQIEDIKGQQGELSGQVVQSLQDELAMTDDLLSTDQQVTQELAKQKGVLEAIASVFSTIQTSNPYEKWAVDLTAAEAHALALNKQMEQLRQEERANVGEQAMLDQKKTEAQRGLEAAEKQLEQLQAGRQYAINNMGPGLSDVQAAANASKKFGLGFTDAEIMAENNSWGGKSVDLFDRKIREKKNEADKWADRINDLNQKIDPDNPGQTTNEMRLNKLQADKRQQMFEAQNEVERVKAQQRLAQEATRYQLGQQRAERNATGQDYGLSSGDRLIRQREYLTRDIADLEQQINAAQAKGADAMALRGQLAQDLYLRQKGTLDLLHRQQEVERDIHQLKIDQNKEFMKAFMGAGPAEMLQKLAAFRMAFDKQGQRRPGMSQGAFFAMSPEMRGNYGQLNADYNPQMLQLKQEREQIKAAIISAFGSLKPESVDQGLLASSETLRTTLAGLKDELAETLTGVATGIKTSGGELVTALASLAGDLNAVANIARNGFKTAWSLPVTAQTSGLGGAGGYTQLLTQPS